LSAMRPSEILSLLTHLRSRPPEKHMIKFTKLALLFVASISLVMNVHASDWTGASGNWSSDLSPGWNGTGVPNAIGAIANFGDIVTGTTTQDVAGGVTVGTISFSSTANISRTITNTAGITLNQDGAGAGFASISNSDAAVGTTNALILATGGTYTLADNLLISNTGGSTASNGSIQLISVLAGTGNITISNVANTVTSATVFPGAIRFQTAVNTFVGSVLVQKGATVFNNAGNFGGAGNTITLGQSGQGSATLMSTAAVTLPNPIVVASGTGGSSVLGSASTGASIYSGTVTLNGNLTYNSFSTNAAGSTISGAVSGPAGITFTNNGAAANISRLTNTGNTYSGGTTVTAGILLATVGGALGSGNISLTGGGVTLTLGTGVAAQNYINDNAAISIVTGAVANLNYTLGSTDVVGSIVLNGVTQTMFGTYGSTTSGADFQSPFFAGNGTLTLIPEPATYMLLGFGILVCAQQFRRKKG
jgi:fibronectin-binding autotransporter adhesin